MRGMISHVFVSILRRILTYIQARQRMARVQHMKQAQAEASVEAGVETGDVEVDVEKAWVRKAEGVSQDG